MTAVEGGDPHILLIDDEPENLRIGSEALQAYGWVVLTARDGETGVKRARYAQPDLVLLDVEMPGVDGFETCRRLKSHPSTADIPVIYVTGHTGPERVRQAFDLGGVDYVTKPFDPAELVARVRTHLELRARRRESERLAEQMETHAAEATAQLRAALARREAEAEARAGLLDVVRLQSDQLRAATRRWLDEQASRDRSLATYLRVEVGDRLALVDGWLARAAAVAEGEAGEHIATARAFLAPLLTEDALAAPVDEAPPLARNPLLALSAREYEVFRLLADGETNKAIAATLGVAPTTVSTYRLRIFEKLGVSDSAALVRLALQFPDRSLP